MLETIRSWLLGLTGSAVFCAVATELTPKGPVKRVLQVVCAAVMAAALLRPLTGFDFTEYALNLSRSRAQAAALTKQGETLAEEWNRRSIEARLRAYILDKARALSCPVSDARVTLRWDGAGFWYPVAVEIEGAYSAALSDAVAAELGVSPEAQSWRSHAQS